MATIVAENENGDYSRLKRRQFVAIFGDYSQVASVDEAFEGM